MSDMKKAMLETAFKTGYEKGYIDEQGYLLKSIPMGDFNALRKHGMVKQVGQEFRLCMPQRISKGYNAENKKLYLPSTHHGSDNASDLDAEQAKKEFAESLTNDPWGTFQDWYYMNMDNAVIKYSKGEVELRNTILDLFDNDLFYILEQEKVDEEVISAVNSAAGSYNPPAMKVGDEWEFEIELPYIGKVSCTFVNE